jgi:hypothetical protein
MTHETYDYSLSTAKGALLLLTCALIAVGSGYMAISSAHVLGMPEVGPMPRIAVFAYVAVCLATGWVALEELRSLLRPSAHKAPIVLDSEAILAPASPETASLLRLTYRGISDIKTRAIQGNHVLEIRHMDGNLTISGAALGSREAFDSLLQSLQARVALTRGYRY